MATGQYNLQLLTPIVSRSDSVYVRTNGHLWRSFEWISGTRTILKIHQPEMAFNAAQAFGQYFTALNQTGSACRVQASIPDFHNGLKRIRSLKQTIKLDTMDRLDRCAKEAARCFDHSAVLLQLETLIRNSVLPIRVVHSDTKVSNLLFDETTLSVRAVVDWDTTKPGSVIYDFGDMVRTSTSLENEDSKRLSEVGVDSERMRALCEGFLSSYFQIDYAEHNLDRAKNQLELLSSLDSLEKDFRKLV